MEEIYFEFRMEENPFNLVLDSREIEERLPERNGIDYETYQKWRYDNGVKGAEAKTLPTRYDLVERLLEKEPLQVLENNLLDKEVEEQIGQDEDSRYRLHEAMKEYESHEIVDMNSFTDRLRVTSENRKKEIPLE